MTIVGARGESGTREDAACEEAAFAEKTSRPFRTGGGGRRRRCSRQWGPCRRKIDFP